MSTLSDLNTRSRSPSPKATKKIPFTGSERELIIKLVRERPIIEDKRIHAKNIELKKEAWNDLTLTFNVQPYVRRRTSHQLKRCWENIKSQRKRELSEISRKNCLGNKKISNEMQARSKRCTSDIQQEQELHGLRIERENLLIERERNLLKFQKEMHTLRLKKFRLEIEMLKKQI